jgi:hypothetical protein
MRDELAQRALPRRRVCAASQRAGAPWRELALDVAHPRAG